MVQVDKLNEIQGFKPKILAFIPGDSQPEILLTNCYNSVYKGLIDKADVMVMDIAFFNQVVGMFDYD